jgi:hypothetical protein
MKIRKSTGMAQVGMSVVADWLSTLPSRKKIKKGRIAHTIQTHIAMPTDIPGLGWVFGILRV